MTQEAWPVLGTQVDMPVIDNAETAPTRTRAGSASAGGRLEFLDALRGLAVLCVVVAHAAQGRWHAYAEWDAGWFKLGQFGVLVFFLCSGFIIPASLERRSSLKEFWIGRFFRLFPLYWVALVACLVLHYGFDVYQPDSPLNPTAVALNFTMMQSFLQQPLVIGASWSLAYEMTFYLTVSVLFVGRIHRRSATTAVMLLLAALGLGCFDKGRVGAGVAVACLIGVLIVGTMLLSACAPRRRVLVVVLAIPLAPLLLNRSHEAWFNLSLFGLMFVGTAFYRYTQGALSKLQTAGLTLTTVAVIVAVNVMNPVAPEVVDVSVTRIRPELPTFLAAFVVFGLAFLLREREMPRFLLRIGLISYSVYLVHPMLLTFGNFAWLPAALTKPAGLVVVLAAALGLASITYRWVERPAVVWGRRLSGAARRADARLPT